MLLWTVAAKHKHGQAENATLGNSYYPRTPEDCFQHPPFPLQISAGEKQTRHTTINPVTKTQTVLRSLIEDC